MPIRDNDIGPTVQGTDIYYITINNIETNYTKTINNKLNIKKRI